MFPQIKISLHSYNLLEMDEELQYEIFVKIFLLDEEDKWEEYGVGTISLDNPTDTGLDDEGKYIVVRYSEGMGEESDLERVKPSKVNGFSEESERIIMKSKVIAQNKFVKQKSKAKLM